MATCQDSVKRMKKDSIQTVHFSAKLQGGGCKYCGSTRHLARNCNPVKGFRLLIVDSRSVMTAHPTTDAKIGADDDDVTQTLRNVQNERDNRRKFKKEVKEVKKKIIKF